MTIGYVLAVVAAIVAIAFSWGATVLVTALVFRRAVERAQDRILHAASRSFWVGVGVFVVVALVAALLNMSHAGPVRIVSGALLTALGVLMTLGSAAIARTIGERIQETGTNLGPFAALTRGTALYVAAGYLPVFGWFVVTPLSVFLSIGGGVAAFTGRGGFRNDAGSLNAVPSPVTPTVSPGTAGAGARPGVLAPSPSPVPAAPPGSFDLAPSPGASVPTSSAAAGTGAGS